MRHPFTNPRDEYGEIYGGALAYIRNQRVALVFSWVMIAGLLVNIFRLEAMLGKVTPVFIRINELGRYDVLNASDVARGTPRANELKSALRTFIIKHYSRLQSAFSRDFPESLFFLTPKLRDAITQETQKERDAFQNNPLSEEIDIDLEPFVTLSEIQTPPYKAQVTFVKRYYAKSTRQTRKPPETFVASIDFETHSTVPNAFVPVNPLGLQITYFRVDQEVK